ncbi:porin [Piscinibacter sp. XHJ-5]|uniref:porin n=1 Tax=Piscinibacter sp. XHJ-5 TaxID=3037797 RepID=UPI002452B24E|nr:porin [Piscinibacter sp. XHJ-5]
MKKSLLALAVLGAFAGAASAQSSVTIYGLLDLAITKGNGGTAANVGANGTSKAWIEKQSASSRLGFRGNEDLGGGLSAQFQIEHRFNPDDGTQSSPPFWQGRSYVQLSHNDLGRIYLGREYTPAFWVQLKLDPFGNDGVGQFGTAMSWAGFNTPSAVIPTGGSARTSNTVGYKTPNWGGLTANVAVGLGENSTPRDTGFNVEYAAGPIYAGLGYEKLKEGPPMAADRTDGNSLFNIGATYDLGFVKPGLYYARAKLAGGTITNKTVEITASANLGPGRLKAGWGRLDPQGDNNTISKLGLGYDYPLSKRTNVYADVGLGKQDNQSNNRAFAFGVKHVF